MIELYTAGTANGYKVSIALEEMGIPYEVRPLDLGALDQKRPEFLAICPNGRIPAIIDRGNEALAVFESGAILIYLAELSGALLPADRSGRSRVIQWLMWQMAGLGPMMGQANVFYRYFHERLPSAIERYQREGRRLLEVLDTRLADERYVAGDYSIADIACWCWARTHAWGGIDVDGLDHLQRWLADIAARPAVRKGITVPTTAAETPEEEARLVSAARNVLA